jgi:OPA family glycerol-3-phosphate transporter-like MFS transporter
MPNPRLRRWEWLTIFLLIVGYAGYYLCRSNLSVCTPQIIDELAKRGMDPAAAKERIGAFVSWGTLAYALGKFASGGMADFLGGRRNFLLGMAGAVLFTTLFALGGGLPLFTLAWIGNRLVQSMGWVGMVKITSRWFSYSRYGTVMGLISLSYLFGDAAARQFMGWLIAGGMGWRSVFFVAASVLGVLLLANLLLLKESPRHVGEPEPEVSPGNVFGARGEEHTPEGLADLVLPLLRSPAFLMVCLLSLGSTLVRETFNTWTPTYFTEVVGLTTGDAAQKSALFPLFGGVSVLLAGVLGDRLGRGGRALMLVGGLASTAGLLLLLGFGEFGRSSTLPVLLVSLIGFVLIGPYAYLAGATSLDFGARRGSATAAGIIDGVGYLGGVLAGDAVARLSTRYGWSGAFAVLAGVAVASCVVAALYLMRQRAAVPGGAMEVAPKAR